MDNQNIDQSPNPVSRTGTGGQEEPILPLQHYWHIILKRIWTILLVFVTVFTLVVFYTFKQPRIFEAKMSIIIDLSTPQVLGKDVQQVVELSAADYWNSEQYFETQYAIIKSRMVAQKVVEKLGLADDLVFLGLDNISDEADLAEALANIDPVDHLVQMTEVDPALQSRIVAIKVRHTNSEMSSNLANAIAESYKLQNIERSKESTYGAYDWLTTQYQEVKEKLESSDEALYDFKRQNNILSTSLEDRQNITSQRLIDLNRQLTEVQAKRMHWTAEVNEIRKMRGDRTNAPVQQVIENPLIQALRTRHTELRTKEAELSGRYLDKHPDVVAVGKQIVLVEKELNREIRNILQASERQLTVLRSSEGQLKGEIDRLKDEALTLNQKELVYTRLEREKETNSRLYDLVLRRLKETDISRLLQNNNIRILDRALVPEVPVMPRVPLNLLIGIVLGLVAGVVLAFFREMLDNTVKTQEDVEGLLGLTFLGVIPTIKEFRTGPDKGMPLPEGELRDLHVHEFPKSSVAECCRTIRTNILFMSPDKKMSRLLVTSAGPREGKTVSAVNIATVMSQSNSKVLVVDTDMRRPRVHRVFGVENDVGLSNLIIGEVSYDDAIKRTPVPNLDVLLCGPIPPNPAELMHTERFHAILRDLDERYDWIIFDSPPTIAVTDAMILSNLVDGVLLVVKGAQTTKDFVRRAKDKLAGVNAPILGCILNDVDLENRQYGNYYYYYRRYGQYYEEDSASDLA
jgi:capsular exopolysaccharide synthesis family protein